RLGNAPAEVLTKDRATGSEGADARYVEPGQGGPRLAAYAYAQTKNPAFARRAILALGLYGGPLKMTTIAGPESLRPVHEAQFTRNYASGNRPFGPPIVSTNDASQSSLTTIELLALCADQLPVELPPAAELRSRNRNRTEAASQQPAPVAAPPGEPER